MRKFYLMVSSLVLVFCIAQSTKVQGQNNGDSLIFNADNISANGGGQFTYSNQNSSVFGKFADGNLGPSSCTCFAGTTLNLQSVFTGNQSIRGGNPGLVNGNLYNQVYFSGFLTFDADNYLLPFRYNRSRFTVTFPSTLTGSLTGYTANPETAPPPIFTSQFNLQGTVTVTLQVIKLIETSNGTVPYYKIHQVRYDFPRVSQNAPENSANFDLPK